MAYASPYFLNWLAGRIAGQAITVRSHTGVPGNDGTQNRILDNAGNRTGLPVVVPAAAITADGARVDNPAPRVLFTPNATSAGQEVTHLSYYFGANFIAWVAASASRTTVAGEDFPLDADGLAFTFALAA